MRHDARKPLDAVPSQAGKRPTSVVVGARLRVAPWMVGVATLPVNKEED